MKINIFKYVFLISLVSLLVSCEMELPEDPMITLGDVELDAASSTVTTNIVGDFQKFKNIKIPFNASVSLPETVEFKISIINSDLPDGALLPEETVYLRKGVDAPMFEILMDCSKIPLEVASYSFDLVLDPVNKQISTTTIENIVNRTDPDPVYKAGQPWDWIDGWVQTEITNNFGAWKYFYWIVDPETDFFVNAGIWQRWGEHLVIENYGTAMSVYLEDGVYYLQFLEKGDVLSPETCNYYYPASNAEKPAVHPSNFGKSGYLAINPLIGDTYVNAWAHVTISADGWNMTIHKVGYEIHGLESIAGQVD